MTALAPSLRLGIVGAGSMGRALLRGILLSGVAPGQVWAMTKSRESAAGVAKEFGVATGTDGAAFVA